MIRTRGLAGLEEDIGVLGSAPQHRLARAQPPQFVGHDIVGTDQFAQIVIGEQIDTIDLMRGPEAVEEVQKRDPAAKRCGMGDEREIMSLLDIAGTQHRPAGGAGRHDIAVIAEDRQRMGGHGARRDVDDRWGQFAGDLEHIGQHQQQTLRCGEGGAGRTGLQCTVQCARRAALGLHLDDLRDRTPQVRALGGRPRVGMFAHR